MVERLKARIRPRLDRLLRRGVEGGLHPRWFGYRHVLGETVPQYFARRRARGAAGDYETIHPEAVADNPLPCNITSREELPGEQGWWGFSFRDVPARLSGETFIATIPDCCIAWYRDPARENGFFPAILTRDGRALQLREIRFRPLHAETLRRAGPPVRIKKATWFIERVYDNYSHWVTAHLPKLLLLKQRAQLADVLLPPQRSPAIDASLRMIKLDPAQMPTFDLSRPLRVEQLTVLGTDRFRPELLRLIPEALGVLDAPAPPHRKVWISRAKAARRRLLNEDEIWALLEPCGFERVHMEELTFSQQVALMKETAVLCALHGAGMTNMLFCPPGAHVIEIADFGYPSPNFYAVAAAMRHRYWLLAGEAIDDGGTVAPGWRDLRVDPEALAAVLPRVIDTCASACRP